MNKKVIAMAVTAALAAPLAAQADVKISGRVAGELVSLTPAGGSGVLHFNEYGQSRIQFDATDESGFYARWALDGRNLGFREVMVGMNAGPGKLQLGRMGGVTKNIEKDPFIATFLELRNNAVQGTAYGSSSFVDNIIQYKMKAGDINLALEYNPTSDTVPSSDNGHFGVALTGKAGGMDYYLGSNNGDGTGADGQSFTKAGIKMPLGGMNLTVGYDSNGAASGDGTKIHAGVDMKMGGGLLDVTFADKGFDVTKSYTRIAFKKKAGENASWHVGYVINGATTKALTGTNVGGDAFGVGVVVSF